MKWGLARSGLTPIFIILVTALALTIFSASAYAQSTHIIHSSPGSTITYNGHGTPGSMVTVMVSTSTSAVMTGDNYQLQLSGISVPACTITISVHPVVTVNFGGSQWLEVLGIGAWSPEMVRSFDPNGETGSYSYVSSGGRYMARVYGTAVAGQSVTVDVYVSQQVQVDSSGGYTASIGTSSPDGVVGIVLLL